MFANYSDEHDDINATPVHLHAAVREFLATISTALSINEITEWDKKRRPDFGPWYTHIREILKYN